MRVVFHDANLVPVFMGHFPLTIIKEWEEGRSVRFGDGVCVAPVKIKKDSQGLRIQGSLLIVTAGIEQFNDEQHDAGEVVSSILLPEGV